MKRSRFRDCQIVALLKGREVGICGADLCCKHGVSDAAVQKSNAKDGVMWRIQYSTIRP